MYRIETLQGDYRDDQEDYDDELSIVSSILSSDCASSRESDADLDTPIENFMPHRNSRHHSCKHHYHHRQHHISPLPTANPYSHPTGDSDIENSPLTPLDPDVSQLTLDKYDEAGSGGGGVTPQPRRLSKKKRRQLEISSRVRSVQPVPRDDDGNYILPIQVGILTVLNLGHVVWDRDSFHNERYIWPVGYTVQREYGSMLDADKSVIYTCRITDGGDGPRFHIEPEDMPNDPIIAHSATGAWTHAVRIVNQIRKREHSNSASGPDYFGFSHPTYCQK